MAIGEKNIYPSHVILIKLGKLTHNFDIIKYMGLITVVEHFRGKIRLCAVAQHTRLSSNI